MCCVKRREIAVQPHTRAASDMTKALALVRCAQQSVVRRRCASSQRRVDVGVACTLMLPGCAEYAVLIRRGTAPAAGSWSLPGGRMNWGETVAGAAERELAEEAGIAGRVLDPVCPAFTATDAIYHAEGFQYVVVHVLAMTEEPIPPALLPSLRHGDDATDAVWAHIDVSAEGRVREGADGRRRLAAGGTRVVSLWELLRTDIVVPNTVAVLSKGRAAMEAHLARRREEEEERVAGGQ